MPPSVEDAIALAARAHSGQRYASPRREPYVFHSLRIMLLFDEPAHQMVAVLHDSIEDTDLDVHDLDEAGYPPEVIEAVDAMTHRAHEAYDDYIDRLATNQIARCVKVADLRENLSNNRRLPSSPERDERIARYERALGRLGATSSSRQGDGF